MKVIAFYLPQFHRIRENDEWWGEGFTEWSNTKKSKPLFRGHYQPREPYEDNYYNIMDPVTQKWQAALAQKYGIYGFCYYHYWFKGRQLLEKPFEQVLRNGEPTLPFCLSWANEPWTRAWDGGNRKILMPQDYGDEKDWEEHFNYLYRAFSDPRYIQTDGKPMFLIYRPASIERCDEMLAFWNDLAVKKGLKGIYFVETLTAYKPSNCTQFEAKVEFEPGYTLTHDLPPIIKYTRKVRDKLIVSLFPNSGKLLLDKVKYDTIWSRILTRIPSYKPGSVFPGAFVDWDNSARRGYRALVMQGASPEKFYMYFSKQIDRAEKVYKSEFIFINAWNEWAEGTYLEPDKKYGHSYLQALGKAVGRQNNK